MHIPHVLTYKYTHTSYPHIRIQPSQTNTFSTVTQPFRLDVDSPPPFHHYASRHSTASLSGGAGSLPRGAPPRRYPPRYSNTPIYAQTPPPRSERVPEAFTAYGGGGEEYEGRKRFAVSPRIAEGYPGSPLGAGARRGREFNSVSAFASAPVSPTNLGRGGGREGKGGRVRSAKTRKKVVEG
eukprot:102538-Amorphochlora_amoeboformis.AAC.1